MKIGIRLRLRSLYNWKTIKKYFFSYKYSDISKISDVKTDEYKRSEHAANIIYFIFVRETLKAYRRGGDMFFILKMDFQTSIDKLNILPLLDAFVSLMKNGAKRRFRISFFSSGKKLCARSDDFSFFFQDMKYQIDVSKKNFFFSSKFDFWVIYWLICRWRISSCDMRLFFFFHLKKWYRIINLAKFFFINSIKILSIYSVFITMLALLLNIII